MSTPKRVAVVTGSNKGIGLGVVRALCKEFNGDVILTSRDVNRGTSAVGELEKEGLSPKYHQLDISNKDSIHNLAEHLKTHYGGLDVLVNNAAMAYKMSAVEPFGEQAENTIRVNYFDTLNVCKGLFPVLNRGARVVNVSSSAGHLSKLPSTPAGLKLKEKLTSPDLTEEELNELMRGFVDSAKQSTHSNLGWPNSTYSASKIGISALTRIQQRHFDLTRPGDDIIINSVHPGYVDTDMTSHKGPLTVEQGAVAITYCALLKPNVERPRGGYVWFDKSEVEWDGEEMPSPY